MESKILTQKLQQVTTELSQILKAVNALSKKHDELIGQQALLEELIAAEAMVPTKKKKKVVEEK